MDFISESKEKSFQSLVLKITSDMINDMEKLRIKASTSLGFQL